MNETTETSGSETQPETTTLSTPPKQEGATSTEATTASENEPAAESSTETSDLTLDFDALKVPEGMTILEEDRTALTELAKTHGLTQDAVAALAEYHFSKLGSTAETLNGQVESAWKTMNDEWRSKTLAQFDGNEEAAVKAAEKFQPIIDRFGGDELRKALTVTGAGNHPAVFAFMQKVTDALGEGTPVAAQAVAKTNDPLEGFYANSPELFKRK